ncbi:2'-5' RNA ligase family protein [Desulfobacter curvatus]|uniref:2'-5' RNA ligase family protein n=1 Tax=Desulfobacter curvatus TaxID=2290 RepID=UPI00037B3D5B|nr:hypothetical protein [Desulfobacter curvatus]
MQRFNIALIFNNDVSEKIAKYSQLLCKDIHSDFVVGKNAIPHMTVAQFDIDPSMINEIWKPCMLKISKTPELYFSGITILPSSNGGAWIEISVLKGQELLNLQRTIINIIEPFSSIKNDTYDMYRPHITVAHTTKGNSINNFPFSYEPIRLKSVETTLGIGLGITFDPIEPANIGITDA